MRKKNHNSRSHNTPIEALESRCLMSASNIAGDIAGNIIVSPSLTITPAATTSTTISGYTPAQIKKAYGISSISLSGVTGDGTGQTIAIVDAYSDANIVSDLSVFDKEFSLSAPASFKQVSVTGSTTKLPASDAGWDSEIALDVEWAHAIASKANIVLVDATTDSIKNLMAAVKYASSISTVSVVSMSWGTSEFSGESAYDSYFTTPSGHIGITYVAASGDEGASGGAEYPAVSPNVLSVGGTTLSISSSGTVSSESAWSDSSGGTSTIEKASSAQSTALGNTYSESPVVSYDADPNTGFAVYDSVSYEGYSGWQEVGGTSAGAPQWAALVAIADQGRVANGSATLDGATGTLPAIYSIYSNATSYVADFTDITSGSSSLGGGGYGGPGGFWGRGGGRFGGGPRQSSSVSATTGYDTLTGVGTPKAAALVNALVSAKVAAAAVKTKTTTTATAAVKKTVKKADIVEAIEADRVNVANSSAMPAAVTYSEATFIPSAAPVAGLSITSLSSFAASASPSTTHTVFASESTNETVSPLLLDAQPAAVSLDETVEHSNNIIAAGAPAPILSEWTSDSMMHTAGDAIAMKPAANVRTESKSSVAVTITAAAVIADGVILTVYHTRKRRALAAAKRRCFQMQP